MLKQKSTLIDGAWNNLKSAHDDLDACKLKLEQAEIQIEEIMGAINHGGDHASL